MLCLELGVAVGGRGGARIQLVQDPTKRRLGGDHESVLHIGGLAEVLENHVHNPGTALEA